MVLLLSVEGFFVASAFKLAELFVVGVELTGTDAVDTVVLGNETALVASGSSIFFVVVILVAVVPLVNVSVNVLEAVGDELVLLLVVMIFELETFAVGVLVGKAETLVVAVVFVLINQNGRVENRSPSVNITFDAGESGG